MEKKLEQMVSENAYNEIVEKVKEMVGEAAFAYIFPSVKKALEEGSPKVKEQILSSWLDVEHLRVCSNCGKLMEEGWYLDYQGYACSDECCMSIMGVSKEDFDRYSIFKDEVEEYLKDEGKGRKAEELPQEEVNEIVDGIVDGLDAYYYTEWN